MLQYQPLKVWGGGEKMWPPKQVVVEPRNRSFLTCTAQRMLSGEDISVWGLWKFPQWISLNEF